MPLAQPSLLRSHRAKSRCPSIVHAFTVSRLRPKAEVYPERLQGSRRARHERIGGMFVDESIEKIKRPAMQDRLKRLKFRSEEHTSELQSLMRISYAVFCLKKKKEKNERQREETSN